MARNLNGYSIFCDDIRQEVAGKTSYIGVYQDNLVTNAPFPLALPKFGISITVFYTPSKSRKTTEIPFKVFLPGEDAPALEGAMPLPETMPPPTLASDGKSALRINAHIILAPLHLKGAGMLRVEAILDGTPTELGRLRVEQTEPATAATASAQASAS